MTGRESITGRSTTSTRWAPIIRSVLNNGLLPPEYEAKVEQHKLSLTSDSEPDPYVRLSSTVAVRQNGERVVALIELVSPGNKSSRQGIQAFVRKVTTAIEHGIHVLVVDLFPPGPRDPNGIHSAIWSGFHGEPYTPAPNQPLTLVSYDAGPPYQAYLEPVAVGEVMPDMPLFLAPGAYVNVPLESTYMGAFDGIARRTRDTLNAPG
jgi:hypothetical protein